MTFFNCFSIASIALSERYPSTKTNSDDDDDDESSRFRFAFLCSIGHGPSCFEVTSMPTTRTSSILSLLKGRRSRRRCSTQWDPDESQRPGNDVNDVDVVLFFFFAFFVVIAPRQKRSPSSSSQRSFHRKSFPREGQRKQSRSAQSRTHHHRN